MTEAEKDAIRARVKTDSLRLDGLAPLYLGRTCPLLKTECLGPECALFLLMGGPNGKIQSGACSVTLLASTAGPIADALVNLGATMVQNAQLNGPRILTPVQGP